MFIVAETVHVSIPVFYKKFFDVIQMSADRTSAVPALIHIITIIFAIHMVEWILFRVTMVMYNTNESKIMARLKQVAFDYLLGHSHGFFADSFTGSLVQRINRFSRAFEAISDTIVFQLLSLAVTVIGAVIITWTLTPLVSVVILAWVLTFLVFNIVYSRMIHKHDLASAAADSKTGGALADAIGNHASITTFTGDEFEQKRFKDISDEQSRLQRKAWNLREVSILVQTFLVHIVEFVVFYYAIKFWQRDAITVGTFVLIQVYIIGVASQLWGLNRIIRTFYSALGDAREMVEIMKENHGIRDIPNAKELDVSEAKVEFIDTAFAYNENKDVLSGLNLTIVPGEKVGLIGHSGAGKTTVTKILLRLYDSTGGEVLIDGQNIKEVTQESLRRNISLVPQDPVLFHRSLMENIRYGRRDATDDEVIKAAKLAHCDEFIDVLPKKYETMVGERGIKLSGGERQRIAIARAILKNAPILLLDEATSSLDSHSETMIQEALDILMKGKTVIVIAHRLSTIRKMDRIIVMEKGSILEEGSHDSLLAKQGSLYKKLWELQAGGFIQE